MIDRRNVLFSAGLGSAALLAPFLALERAAAQVKIQTPDDIMADTDHMAKMAKVLGPSLMGAKVHLVTTEPTLAPVSSDLGLAIVPTVMMADCPKNLDLIFVPGGSEGTMNVMTNKVAIAFIADRASRAKHVTSVCTGSMILGKAGLLKGKRATSHWSARPVLADFGAIPVEARVVTDGNVTTGAGVSAGLDFAIAIVAALRGKAYAQTLMLEAEYHPEPPFPGGTLATTPADVGAMMTEMFAPLEGKFRAIAKAG